MGQDHFPLNIFLADDDIDDCQFFESTLAQVCQEAKLSIVHEGKALLELLSSKSFLPDLIVLDLNMPVMDGYDCMKNIKCNEDYKNIPVVILTTSSYQADIERLALMGANLFLTKPQSYNELKGIVQQIMLVLGIPSYKISV